jgi:hypothetical protein
MINYFYFFLWFSNYLCQCQIQFKLIYISWKGACSWAATGKFKLLQKVKRLIHTAGMELASTLITSWIRWMAQHKSILQPQLRNSFHQREVLLTALVLSLKVNWVTSSALPILLLCASRYQHFKCEWEQILAKSSSGWNVRAAIYAHPTWVASVSFRIQDPSGTGNWKHT